MSETATRRGALDQEVHQIQETYGIIGREAELRMLLLALRAQKHIIIEGEVGTGKTLLARSLAQHANANFIRVDGSEDVFSHTLTGYFDPPMVVAKGYVRDAFIFGPLSDAMRFGSVLFINELNRVPESTQNVLLSALDEQLLVIPKLGQVEAVEGFRAICTQNPAAHVGVSSLGEALKDRFVWIQVRFQPEEEEVAIVEQKMTTPDHEMARVAVRVSRLTRDHPDLRRGASIRGAIDLAQLAAASPDDLGVAEWKALAVMALTTKIELSDEATLTTQQIIEELVDKALADFR